MNNHLEINGLSLPQEFVSRMREQLGADADDFFRALATPSPTSVRLNPRKPTRGLFPDARPLATSPNGLLLAERPSFTLMPEFHAGAFYVQESASMVYELIANELVQRLREAGKQSIKVLDSCAAPGGKTTALISALGERDFILANEYDRKRANILLENLCKWGYANVGVSQGDTSRLLKLQSKFDILVADAPCSGEGMMRKEPKAIEQWSPGLIRQCAATQREILDNIVPLLAPGGYLVYSTCTYNREENEEQLEYLQQCFNLCPITLDCLDGCCKRFYPHTNPGEGLFVTVLQRSEEESSGNHNREERRKRKDTAKNAAKQPLPTPPEGYEHLVIGEDVHLIPTENRSLCQEISDKLNCLGIGVKVGTLKGKDLSFSSHLALAGMAENYGIPTLQLSREEMLRYLHKEALTLPADAPRGHVCLAYNGLPVGLAKNLGNRANNLWPAEWKIRNL